MADVTQLLNNLDRDLLGAAAAIEVATLMSAGADGATWCTWQLDITPFHVEA
jgi:hypothetical protein